MARGVWELFIPRMGPGAVYKYEIVGPWNDVLPLRADPVAWATELPPATGSVVADPTPPRWTDDAWMARRAAHQAPDAPMSIYEVHAFSWMPAVTTSGGWEAFADRLVPYATRMGFTHVELLPIMEHPFGGSWGYQPLGQFAPSARLGSPDGFARFVDRCHNAGLGVILDWVPAHFPTDAHGLAQFDGTALYEHQDPREGFHQDWNTLIFNLGRNEVRNFLIASALYWLEHYHVDGLRVDAVASMLYRDYSRKAGEWIPNQYGGRENLESISFLQELSHVVRARVSGAVLIAEESTAWPGVTQPPENGGLGFDYKWNMGWMHDTLHYMQEDPVNRRWHHGELSFGLVYAFSEKFVLPLSHDEVWCTEKARYGVVCGVTIGKKPPICVRILVSCGRIRARNCCSWAASLARPANWNHDTGPDWSQLEQPLHAGIQSTLRDLNTLYRDTPALHQRDADGAGFRWVVLHDAEQSVFAYLRFGHEGTAPVLVVCNFTPVPRPGYRMGVPCPGKWLEVMNTDADVYGGSNMGNAGGVWAEDVPMHDQPHSVTLTLPPLSTLILRAES